MTTWDRHLGGERPQHRRKTPSFSSSLLDAICHSIDESREGKPKQDFTKRDKPFELEEETTSLRRSIMVEKWMENHTKYTKSSRHVNSDSSSSTDSSIFSSSEPETASKCTPKSTPKSLFFAIQNPKTPQTYHSTKPQKAKSCETTPKNNEGRFTRTKSRAMKIYTDLKKVKQPISPGSKIINFLNSLFTSRNTKNHHHHHRHHHQQHHRTMENWSSVTKSRSVKDSTTMCGGFTSRSCLSKPSSPRNKSKRCVRFDPVNVVYDHDPIIKPMKNINSNLQRYNEMKSNRYESDDDDDDMSCTSSDLFELENIGMHREELPVYGTTSLKINQAIANGLFMY